MVLEKGGGDNSRVLWFLWCRVLWGSPPGLRATPWSRCPWPQRALDSLVAAPLFCGVRLSACRRLSSRRSSRLSRCACPAAGPPLPQCSQVFPTTLYHREPLLSEAAVLAGKCFLLYRRRGGLRNSPLPDFYIGAHAAIGHLALLTRDAARYRSYFPTAEILAPTRPPI